MIQLTRINRAPLVLNSDLIEHVEITPDTVISLTTGQKFMVLESSEEVIRRVVEFRQSICTRFQTCNVSPHAASPPKKEAPEMED